MLADSTLPEAPFATCYSEYYNEKRVLKATGKKCVLKSHWEINPACRRSVNRINV